MKSIFFFFVLLLSLASCKNTSTTTQDEQATDTTVVSTKYTLTPFAPSHDYQDATLASMKYEDGKFSADVSGTSYKLGEQTPDAPQKQCANSAEGQHIHLIINDEPYIAKYTSSFDQDIPDGDHYVLSFLSRSYHESLKSTAAHKVVKANVSGKSFTSTEPVQGPMLFYSRPKGLYTGEDTKKVMLDFYLVNTDMSGYKVEADINGEKHMIDKWQPYYIEGLPEGDNTIKLSLLDMNGQLVNAPLNPVSRTFQLEMTPSSN